MIKKFENFRSDSESERYNLNEKIVDMILDITDNMKLNIDEIESVKEMQYNLEFIYEKVDKLLLNMPDDFFRDPKLSTSKNLLLKMKKLSDISQYTDVYDMQDALEKIYKEINEFNVRY